LEGKKKVIKEELQEHLIGSGQFKISRKNGRKREKRSATSREKDVRLEGGE